MEYISRKKKIIFKWFSEWPCKETLSDENNSVSFQGCEKVFFASIFRFRLAL